MDTGSQSIGPYTLHEKLGSNRRHHVFRAVNTSTGQVVALKLINISTRVDPEIARKKIQLEIKILQRLEHPNIVKILDAGIFASKMFIAMELVEGETLASIMSRRGKLAWDQAIDYARQIAEGLNYIHQQELVHLKLNPEKIIITNDGRVKITDLRVNRARKRRWDEAKRRELDIAAYMAPEQMTDEGGTAKSDLYGLGVLMFEMITGKLPFEPDTLPRLLKAKREKEPPRITNETLDCPVWVDNLVVKLLNGNPAERPHSSYALVAMLKEVQRMHAEGRSMTEELTRGFNPLTAGRDKSEALNVLGRQDSFAKSNDNDEPTISKTTILALVFTLFVGVTLTAGLLYFALKKPTEDQLFRRASAALDTGENTGDVSLLRAKRYLEPLLERFPDGEHAEEARGMLDSVEAQLAERKMKRRMRFGNDPKSETEKLVVEAWQLAELGDLETARDLYQQAVDLEDDHEEAPRFRTLANRELKELNSKLKEEPQSPEEKRVWVLEQLVHAAQLQADDKQVESREVLLRLQKSIGDDQQLQDLMVQVKQMLDTKPGEKTDSSNDDDDPESGSADDQGGEIMPINGESY